MSLVVLYRSPWQLLDDGWHIATRSAARMMALGGLDVRLSAWSHNPVDAEAAKEVRPFLRETGTWDVQILSYPILPSVRSRLVDLSRSRGKRAFHAMFERAEVEHDLGAELNQLDGVWAQCAANNQTLQRAGCSKAITIPFGYFDDDPHLGIPPPRECRNFYWIGRFEPRKAPDNLIRAFMRAFRPREATLTLKLSPYPYPVPFCTPEEVIESELGRNGWRRSSAASEIRVDRGRFSKTQMLQFHASHDCYVSASRGEGLDLSVAAAKLSGRPVVTTDSGAPTDLLNDGDVLVPATGTVTMASYPFLAAVYNDYDLDDLVTAMQRMCGSAPVGSRLPATCRASNVGKMFREWIDGIAG